MKTIRAVLFDMDGVITDSMGLHEYAWRNAFKEIGLILDSHDIFRREGMSGIASVRDIFLEKGIEPPDDIQLENLINRKHFHFKGEIDLFPHVDQIISYLSKRRIKLALVTGSHRSNVERIIPVTLLEKFSAIVTSDDVVNGKPDPESYERAMELLECTTDDCVVIENAPMGIKSAKNARLKCLAIETTLPQEYLSGADIIFSDHRSLFEYLKSHI